MIEFIVYYNTSFDAPGQYHEAETRTLTENEREISLSPWASYTFHVKARNNIGMSGRSQLTSGVCRSPASSPSRSPRGVCTDNRDPRDLVIVWEVREIFGCFCSFVWLKVMHIKCPIFVSCWLYFAINIINTNYTKIHARFVNDLFDEISLANMGMPVCYEIGCSRILC